MLYCDACTVRLDGGEEVDVFLDKRCFDSVNVLCCGSCAVRLDGGEEAADLR